MNNSTILTKFRKYFFVIIICLLIGIGYSFNLNQKSEYIASISIGFSPRASLVTSSALVDKEYTNLLTNLTQYMQNRFTSLNIQESYAKNMGLALTKSNEKKAIYDISPTGLGYINLSMTTNNQIAAQKFLDTTKEVINGKLIPEWNQERVQEYQVTPNSNIVSSITESKPTQVTLAIPLLVALILGSIITLLLPLPKNYNNGDTKGGATNTK